MSVDSCAREQERGPDAVGRSSSGKTRVTRAAGPFAAASAFLLDQASKGIIFANMQPGEELVLGPILSILPGWNQGAAFGLGQGTAPMLLVALAVAVSAWLATLMLKSRSTVEAVGLGAAIGGALANVADRTRFGAVRDFIDVHWNALYWPTFNAADMFVVGGLLLFTVADVYRQRKHRQAGP